MVTSAEMKLEMNTLRKIVSKIRYGLVLHEISARLGRMGVRIEPYYLLVESLEQPLSDFRGGFEDYEVSFLGPEDMREIASTSGRMVSEGQLLLRLSKGNICLGAKYQGQIAAYSWCDLKECNFEGRRFRLAKDEAYLFDAYTLYPFRGKRLAPYLRSQCYLQLTKLGKRRVYSVTDFFNRSARRFKTKLDVRPVELCLFIEVFKKWRVHSCLKKYSE
jgi:hypothetical protein